jgi:hypothetical protein
MASWPSAPSTSGLVTTAAPLSIVTARAPSRRSLTVADTCAGILVCIGRRLVPAGPLVEDMDGGREGRERPGLPRIWVVTGLASRVAHARCQRPNRPDNRGPDPVQICAQFRAQTQGAIRAGHVPTIRLRGYRTVGQRTDGRSPVHTELLVRLKQVGDLPPIESTTRLGDWYGNVLRIGRRQHFLFISERSRLPIVLPIREAKRLGAVFPDAVCERLATVGRCRRRRHRQRTDADVGIGVRPDQESQLARHLERLRIHGPIGGRAASRTRVARGADAVPLADTYPSAGRCKPDRVDGRRVWASIGVVTAPDSRRSGSRFSGSAWARQGAGDIVPPQATPQKVLEFEVCDRRDLVLPGGAH